jgi:hypothetical protein
MQWTDADDQVYKYEWNTDWANEFFFSAMGSEKWWLASGKHFYFTDACGMKLRLCLETYKERSLSSRRQVD